MRFEEYVQQRGRALLGLAYVLTSDAHLAEDVVQSALAQAYRRWRVVGMALSPDAYVRRIVVNVYLDWQRRRSSSETPRDRMWELTATSPDPSEGVTSQDHLRWLLSQLPPRARTILALRYYADLDDSVIAEAMGISASTVRATASRALSVLRKMINADSLKELP